MSGCSSLKTTAFASLSFHLGYPHPSLQPAACCPQGDEECPQGRFGNGRDTAESCCWHILPSGAAGNSQNVYLYSDTFKQMSHQWDPFPAPIWLQTVN